MKASVYDVVLIGALANVDLILAEALSREGLRCAVVRLRGVDVPDPSAFPAPLQAFALEDIYTFENARWFWTFSRNAGCVISITSVLPFMLAQWWPWSWLRGYPPILNISTGSDVAELALERSRAGWLCRSVLRRAAMNLVPPYPATVRALRRLRLENFEFFRFVYWLAETGPRENRRGPIIYLHPSHLDWGITDRKPHRNSTKGNDRFLRAFFRAAAAGANIRCLIADRGPDREVARKLVNESGFSDLFEWLPPMTQSELKDRMRSSDVVVDQFDVGGFGGIAIEAMAQAKPVVIHIDDHCWPLVYDTAPPVLKCTTEDEILKTILMHQDREELNVLGDRAAAWVDTNYRSGASVKRLALRIAVMTGKQWPLQSKIRQRP